MIHNQFKIVNENLGVKIPNARVWAGWDKGIYLFSGGSPAERANAGRSKRRKFDLGAGEGNRTLVTCLEGKRTTTVLHPH